MKICPNCKITVCGTHEYCPLCQNELISEEIPDNIPTAFESAESENTESLPKEAALYFPAPTKLKQMSFFYRLQLFIFLAAAVICLSLDFLFELSGEKHWSLVASAWMIGFQILLKRLIRKHSLPVYFVANIASYVSILLLATAYYLGFFRLCTDYILPCICMLTLTLDFIFYWTDATGNTLVYVLCNALIGIAPYMVLTILLKPIPMLWTISLIASVLFLLALIVFIGHRVKTEILKRLNI